MPFTRDLDPKFIDHLNGLYNKGGSWWRRLVDDPEVFIAVRNNSLNTYAGGGSIARVVWTGKRVEVLADESLSPVIVTTVSDYVREFPRIKLASKLLSGKERQAENLIAKLPCVIDMEAAFDTRAESMADEPDFVGRTGRLDLVIVDDGGCLGFWELKLFENAELRESAGEVAAVCRQLGEYGKWLTRNEQAVLAAYRQVDSLFRQLHGSFFEAHRREVPSAVDKVPRLLIVDFERSNVPDVNALRKELIEVVRQQFPDFGLTRVRTLGSPRSVRLHHLTIV